MKIHRELVDLIFRKRNAIVLELLGGEGLGILPSHENDPPTRRSTLNELDDIIYTLDFLKKEGLVEDDGTLHFSAPPEVGAVLKSDLKGEGELEQYSFIQKWIEQNYNNRITIRTPLSDFIKRGYITVADRTEKNRLRQNVLLAILSSGLFLFLIQNWHSTWNFLMNFFHSFTQSQ